MKPILIIALLFPFVAGAQRYIDPARSQSVQGTIIMPTLMNLDIVTTENREMILQNFEEFASGKVYNNYFVINVKANKPWVVSVMAESRYFEASSEFGSSSMPVSLLSLKKSDDAKFLNISHNPQPLLYSANNNISNNYSIDLKLDAPFDYRSSDYWTSLIFTITSQ